ncbi:CBS domain-containing protein [Terriglobus roseus DSM 18391]|uniref:CBS domain-containing protein n=1 Tax=Terriglobus roseus (strain DSM 18391 / NRRL B-41598 / KBS 63) TaxID=926566 RepID=I3ZDM9_TERRK|nr:hemolysin family protein [Terriglobus roseus]AFL87347.1 CBS domain-containing protein [Terriglobus roseus DSM 18391]
MNLLSVLLIAGLLFVLTVAAYADRVYSEMGKFLAREYQDNLDAWVDGMEPHFGLSRDSVALSASILRQTSLASIALILGVRRFTSASTSTWVLYAQTLAELALIIILFDRMLPQVLFARTRGEWTARIRYILQALFYIVLPITLFLGLLLSIASLAEHDSEATQDHPDEGVDALLEAGEEEGILEESDRALVRSVVEFGDMVVREVMTPRPEMFAVPEQMTLAEFTTVLQGNPFSRVPVYHGTVDEITGIAFAHDLLQVADTDAGNLTVREMQRPAAFVPEPKKVNELLREMQSEKQHMRIVIDEYGTVAGLVTIEDLIEAIVGNIEDEHDEDTEAIREDDGAYIVPGSMDVNHLRDLLSKSNDEDEREPLRLRTDLEASTVGGLVSELAGHIPLPGEVIEADGLHIDVLAATSRLVTRVRVRTLPPPDPSED